MYETEAFWGLEANTNAATLNNTFNTITGLGLLPVVLVVILVIYIVFFVMARRAF